jgi:CDP-glucose 4,6-dehydratase
MQANIFNGKAVLVTGHTGFKGTWLSTCLSKLGADVIGISADVPTNPSHFEVVKDSLQIDLRFDICELAKMKNAILEYKPEIIFHLAAQPIVFDSYNNPLNTFKTNVLGTGTVLEALRLANYPCTAVLITSDKCYDNVEWTYGYRENDRLGGKDPYSGSKGATELLIKSFFYSYFNLPSSNVCIGIARAGNVIGGGDWAPYRIVPDCVTAWSRNKLPEIRNPNATRPWQHVLEPLSGYLTLAASLHSQKELNGEAYNFGPPANQNYSVSELIEEMKFHWSLSDWLDKSENNSMPKESGLLKLNCDKALHGLGWQPTLNFKETAKWTAEWYKAFYNEGKEVAKDYTLKQIDEFVNLSISRKTSPLFIS